MANDIGSVKAALRTLILSSAFTTKLRAIETEFGDGIALPDPDADSTFDHVVNIPPSFPLVEMEAPETQPDDESDAEDETHQIWVYVTLIGDDEGTLTKQTERWLLALKRMTWQDLLNDAGGNAVGAGPIRPGRRVYARMARVEDLPHPFIKGGGIQLFVSTFG